MVMLDAVVAVAVVVVGGVACFAMYFLISTYGPRIRFDFLTFAT